MRRSSRRGGGRAPPIALDGGQTGAKMGSFRKVHAVSFVWVVGENWVRFVILCRSTKECYANLTLSGRDSGWMKIKGALADANGTDYFESQLKNSAVPQLRGTLVSAKPACRPKGLLVAVPLPDAPQPLHAEITLKLDKPSGGKPEEGSEFHWRGSRPASRRALSC